MKLGINCSKREIIRFVQRTGLGVSVPTPSYVGVSSLLNSPIKTRDDVSEGYKNISRKSKSY